MRGQRFKHRGPNESNQPDLELCNGHQTQLKRTHTQRTGPETGRGLTWLTRDHHRTDEHANNVALAGPDERTDDVARPPCRYRIATRRLRLRRALPAGVQVLRDTDEISPTDTI